MLDRLGRPLRDLRISVTDRCNFRCVYCMPRALFGADHPFLPRRDLLDYEEIARIAEAAAVLGVNKIRLTGGEPLLRHDLDRLIAMLVEIDGIEDIALTTNGTLLAKQAAALHAAGLKRITVSLDAVQESVFKRMADTPTPLATILDGIEQAQKVGLSPVKINTVVKRGLNDQAVVDVAEYFRHSGCTPRFIEYMDVGNSNGWRLDEVVTGADILDAIHRQWPLVPVEANYRGEVASRYRYVDGGGEIGLITSVSQPFCGDCTRARLSAEGKLYTCLFASHGVDLRELLRSGARDDDLIDRLAMIWGARRDRYSELRAHNTPDVADRDKIEMSYIGG